MNGQRVYKTEVVMEKVQLFGSRQETAQGVPQNARPTAGNRQQMQPQQQPAAAGSLFCPQQLQDMPAVQGMSYGQPTDDYPF